MPEILGRQAEILPEGGTAVAVVDDAAPAQLVEQSTLGARRRTYTGSRWLIGYYHVSLIPAGH